jgi:hypothetical protein
MSHTQSYPGLENHVLMHHMAQKSIALPYAGLSPSDALWNLPAVSNKVKIIDKVGKFVTFELNEAQSLVWRKIEDTRYKNRKVRLLVLKARQQGISTLMALYDFQIASFHTGSRVMVMTHLDDTTSALFGMVQRFYETFPGAKQWLPTNSYSQKGLEFEGTRSLIKVATAGSATVGHGLTITHFHGSEVSRWPNMDLHLSGIMQAVPDAPDTSVVFESVANGRGDGWHRMWQDSVAGISEFDNIFVPWYMTSEYAKRPPADIEFNDEELVIANRFNLDDWQMYWRRTKILNDFSGNASAFAQMYPSFADEAFARSGNSLIKLEQIEKARARVVDGGGNKLAGYDPAGGGKDRGCLVRRQGNKAYGIQYNKEPDAMAQAGMLAKVIQAEGIRMMFIDSTGASMGRAIVDRLRELGFTDRVTGVGFSESADDSNAYINKRAEIWYRMAEWFGGNVSCPDDDAFEQDCLAPNEIDTDSNNRRKVESKKDMLKRGIRSPDGGDALAMTFAYRVADQEVAQMKKVLGLTTGLKQRQRVAH